ncbi:unannotated protein [freshwater metagenome]|uniref:Unannotated protein n=1 Tax=freshwater metagenome TaxID=449393 RepID=A0A6J7KS03_9ZZZZ
MQAHITRRQDDLLARAMTMLADCPDDTLPAQVHRLVGTLGTYQLMEASALMRACEGDLQGSGPPPREVAVIRRTTLTSLSEIVAARGAYHEGTSPQ